MARPEEGFQKGKVLTISAAHFVHDCYTAFLAPALPLIIEKLGISLRNDRTAGSDPAHPLPVQSLYRDHCRTTGDALHGDLLTCTYSPFHEPDRDGTGIYIPGHTSFLFRNQFHPLAYSHPGHGKAVSGKRTGKGMSYYMVGGELARTAGPLIILGVISLWGLEGTWKMMPLGFVASLVLYRLISGMPHQTYFLPKAAPGGQLLEDLPSIFCCLPADRRLHLFPGRHESLPDLLPAHLSYLTGQHPSLRRPGPDCNSAGRCRRSPFCRNHQR